MKQQFDGLLFDKDGTLIDFDKTWSVIFFELARKAANGNEEKMRHLLECSGYNFEKQRFSGGGLLATGNIYDMIELWYPGLSPEEQQEKIAEQTAYSAGLVDDYLTPIEGVGKTLRVLKEAGFKLGIATNDSEQGARQNIERLGWDGLFDLILGFDSVEKPKPAGDQVQAFAAFCALSPDRIAMIGDNSIDMNAAHAGGAYAIGVLSGNGEREQLEPLANQVLYSVNDLPGWLGLI